MESVSHILLTSSRTRLLPTIISRCSAFIMSGETNDDGDITNDAKEFLSLLFDAKEYDMLLLSKKYEKMSPQEQIIFLMEAEKLPFMEAVEILSSMAGMKMPEPNKADVEREKKRSDLQDIMEQVCQFYQNQLK